MNLPMPPFLASKRLPTCHLFYRPLCPGSRKVRLILSEKAIKCSFSEERSFAASSELRQLHHEVDVPILQDRGYTLVRVYAIQEYLEDAYPATRLLGSTTLDKAEIRRLVSWFDMHFARQVTDPLLKEKIFKRAKGRGQPSSDVLRAIRYELYRHLAYMEWLVDRRNWLAGKQLSLADLTAAAHLSCVDYLGDIPWHRYEGVKGWYMRIKSRPSFRSLLLESFAGVIPATHYRLLDF